MRRLTGKRQAFSSEERPPSERRMESLDPGEGGEGGSEGRVRKCASLFHSSSRARHEEVKWEATGVLFGGEAAVGTEDGEFRS